MRTPRALAVLAAPLLALAWVAPAQAGSSSVDYVPVAGSVYECKGLSLTASSGTFKHTTTVTTQSDGSVRIQEKWTISSPVTLSDPSGRAYTMKSLSQTSDVTSTNGALVGYQASKVTFALGTSTWGVDQDRTDWAADGSITWQSWGSCSTG